jgi:hypothetical protein
MTKDIVLGERKGVKDAEEKLFTKALEGPLS